MYIFFVYPLQSVCKTDCHWKETHKNYRKDLRCHSKSHINDQDRSHNDHGNRLGHYQNRIESLSHSRNQSMEIPSTSDKADAIKIPKSPSPTVVRPWLKSSVPSVNRAFTTSRGDGSTYKRDVQQVHCCLPDHQQHQNKHCRYHFIFYMFHVSCPLT